jgi:hypothetical protein
VRGLHVDQPNLTCAKRVGKRRTPNKHRGGTQFVSVVPPRASLPPSAPCFA